MYPQRRAATACESGRRHNNPETGQPLTDGGIVTTPA
jgi:hypothetical protein